MGAAPFAIAGLALLARVVLILGMVRSPASDERDFLELARSLATTGRYEIEGEPTAYRPVGYPAFIASIERILGPDVNRVRIVQAALDAVTSLFLFLLLRRRDPRAALLAAAWWAAYTPAILFSSLLLSETLFVFLLVLLTWVVTRVRDRSYWWSVMAGALAGALALVKPTAFLLVAPLSVLLAWHGVRPRRLVLISLVTLATVAPWAARNAIVLGAPTLSTNTGANLLIGNNREANGAYAVPDVPESVRSASGEAARSREASRVALRYIASDPWRFIAMGVKKGAYLLSSEAELAVGFFTREEGAGFRDRYRALPAWIHAAVSLPFAFILVLGTLGSLTRPQDDAGLVFLSLLLSALPVHLVTFGGSRFHFPWMPFFTLFAAEWAEGGWRRWREASRVRKGCAVGIVLLYGAVWIAELMTAWG